MIFSQTFGNNIGQVINVIKMSFKQFLINYRSVSTIIHSHLSWDVVGAVEVELGSFSLWAKISIWEKGDSGSWYWSSVNEDRGGWPGSASGVDRRTNINFVVNENFFG